MAARICKGWVGLILIRKKGGKFIRRWSHPSVHVVHLLQPLDCEQLRQLEMLRTDGKQGAQSGVNVGTMASQHSAVLSLPGRKLMLDFLVCGQIGHSIDASQLIAKHWLMKHALIIQTSFG